MPWLPVRDGLRNGTATPWTSTAFRAGVNSFQFAIVSDRNGECRPGVFEKAVTTLNRLQPEFVMSVGDFIYGYSEDEFDLQRQWKVFRDLTAPLEMPLFHIPGNHDISNPTMCRVYRELFGRDYYWFLYRNVLFLCLNTQDGPEGLSEAQVRWACAAVIARTRRRRSNSRR